MIRLRLSVAALVLSGMALHAAAQQTAPAPSGGWSVETVIVTAHATGPAIWHVTKGDGEVAILGIVQPLPDGFQWNTAPLAALLDKAHLLLLPVRPNVPLFPGLWFLMTERSLLKPPEGKTLWDIISPSVASNLAAARDLLHQDRNHYDDMSPIVAALRLESDYRHVYMMTTHEPEDTIRALARARKIDVRRVASYDVIPGAEDLLKLPASRTGQCLDSAVNDVNIAIRHARPAAEAWAVGDVSGTEANWSEPQVYDCILSLSAQANALDRRAIDDTVEAITHALDFGGHTVAVVDIGLLLRRNGVLEQLMAQGARVNGPKG